MKRAETGLDTCRCPCDSGQIADACCLPLLRGEARAATAEALMRSRYAAFSRNDDEYLLATWDPRTRPASLSLEPERQWLGLRIKQTSAGQADDSEGVVEFVARSRLAGRGERLHEISRFRKAAGIWYYIDGERGTTDDTRRRAPRS